MRRRVDESSSFERNRSDDWRGIAAIPPTWAGKSKRRRRVAATQTEYEFAQGKFARYHGLLEQKFVNACALDAKRNPMNANRAKFEQAKANLAVAQNHAGYATLVASVTA